MRVKAIFKGENGSCGFEYDVMYNLNVIMLNNMLYIEYENLACPYTSFKAFLNNWDIVG